MANPPIYIGLDADMSAVAKEGGEAIRRGAQIAINEINADGGVLGRPLELIVKDHRGNPARGIANIKQFAATKDLVAVLGGVHTPVALKELPVIHQHQLLYLDPWAAGTPIVDNGYTPNYVFRVSVRDKEAGKVLIKHAKDGGAKKVGLLLERTGWGRSNEESMRAAAEAMNVTIADTQWFNWGQKDMRQAIENFVIAEVQAIILVANAPEGAAAAKTLLEHEQAASLPVISHWGITGGAFVDQLGLPLLRKLDIAVLQTYSFAAPHDQQRNQQVLEAYQNTFDPKVTALSLPSAVGVAHAYDLMHLLAIAIDNANSIARPKVREALESIPEYKGLVKHYKPPFTPARHDALLAEDYILSTFNEQGQLTPLGR